MARHKYRQSAFHRLYQAVRDILFREWDPIGINANSALADEYDSYAPGICRLLQAGADEWKLANHLCQLQTVSMGLSHVDEEHNCRIARRLRALVE
jgi:hypothetical protein